MFRPLIAAAVLAGAPLVAQAQSTSAPLMVTATVISTCKVDAPSSGDPSRLATLPVSVRCARRGAAARVQRPPVARRSEPRDALLVINF